MNDKLLNQIYQPNKIMLPYDILNLLFGFLRNVYIQFRKHDVVFEQ